MDSWPSERVAHGGLFHLPKVKYSKETHALLKRKSIRSVCSAFKHLIWIFITPTKSADGWAKDVHSPARSNRELFEKWSTVTKANSTAYEYNKMSTERWFPQSSYSETTHIGCHKGQWRSGLWQVSFLTRILNSIPYWDIFRFRYHPKPTSRPPCEQQKIRLQAKMSGIKEIDEADFDPKLAKEANEANETEEIDPIDERKLGFSLFIPIIFESNFMSCFSFQCWKRLANGLNGWAKWRLWARPRNTRI